ncbi:hypothetical protein EIP91_002157 [Steccherinum ochraceum]|uniref:Uncharacterized protein n=1 Tax=Steccherinum ochraceum TaxID=92696 RepID=A0A4R0RCT6_9APHY|nr:hypothetical protein EIP91_002157 [Steccherinum ochraceum]
MLHPSQESAAKVAGILTTKLLALNQSTFHDLTQSCWSGKEAMRALKFLTDISRVLTVLQRDTAAIAATPTDNGFTQRSQSSADTQALPLPIAAAHFPSQLQSLQNNSLERDSEDDSAWDDSVEKNRPQDYPSPLVTDRLSAEAHSQAALQGALAAARSTQAELSARLKTARARHRLVRQSADLKLQHSSTMVVLHGERYISSTSPSSLSFPDPPSNPEAAIQDRISHIRDTLQSSWPPIPDPISSPSPEPALPPTRLPQPTVKAKRGAVVNFMAPSGHIKTKSIKRMSPRKSNVVTSGRARRSSAFARRKSRAFESEVDRIADSFLDESTSDVSLARSNSPTTPHRSKITHGQPLTPRSMIKKTTMPRPSFDIEQHEKAIAIELPRKSLGHISDEEARISEESEEDVVYEGNSMTLKEILLQADATQYDLLQQGNLADDSFEW